LGMAYLAQHQYAAAIAELEATSRISGSRLDLLSVLGLAYAEAGRRPEAQQVLTRLRTIALQRPDMGHEMAQVLAGLGETARAFAQLDQAYLKRDGSLILLKVNPMFDALRPDPRYESLMRRVGLLSN